MSQPQSAICANPSRYALFLTLTLRRGTALGALRRACAELPHLTEKVARATGERGLVSAIAIGARAWPRLFGCKPPRELVPFAALKDGPRQAPATPADLFLHIHSDRHDANFALVRRFAAEIGKATKPVEEVLGFRNLDKRDLTGFVDGTENPKGKDRPEVALVGREDRDFAGGSYVSIQRWVHDLARWERQTVAVQEKTIGRTKKANIEMDDRVKPPTAHIARVVIEEDGREIEILRQSMPYGTVAEAGLYFVAYGRSPHPFLRMLENMVRRDPDGHYDRLMDFSRPVTGASFFAPSVALLKSLS